MASSIQDPSRLRIGILVLPRFTLSVLGLFLDPIRLAADEADHSRQMRCQWDVVTLSGQPVECSLGMSLRPSATIASLHSCDLIVVAGGVLQKTRADRIALCQLLRQLAQSGKTIVGLCTGAFRLVEAGLLDADHCAVSEFHLDDLSAVAGRTISETSHFSIRGRIMTASTGQGAAQLALSLIRTRLSGDLARKSARILRLPYDVANSGVAMPELPEPPCALIRRAMAILEDTLADPIPMAAIARRLGVTTRQLERLFRKHMDMTASEARETIRIRRAVELLTTTDRKLFEIAQACGYVSSTALNRAFSRAGQALPREIRARASNRVGAAA